MEAVRCYLLLVLALTTTTAGAFSFVFPGQLGHPCITHAGVRGVCSRECGEEERNTGQSTMCGVLDSAFLVCCAPTLPQKDTPVKPQIDITKPRTSFQCGVNSRNLFSLTFGYQDGHKVYAETEDLNPYIHKNQTVELENGTAVVVEIGVGAVGAERAEKNAWPWMALIGERNGSGFNWFCGGVLINEEWVLSALHCFTHRKPEVVRLAEHNYKSDTDGAPHEDFSVAELVHYPDYSFPQAYHDLTLLRLSPKVTLKKFISPVCLAWDQESSVDISERQATLTGYGDTQFGGIPTSYLQEVNVTVFPSSQCDQNYATLPHYASTWPRGIGKETLCAGDPDGGRDACQGDSGGPLMSQDSSGRFVLAGIVSRGYGCGHKDYPGLYVNMRHPPYLSWVKKVAF